MPVHICSCTFMAVHVCSCMFMYVHGCSCLFMCVHGCSCMFMYVHVCSCLFMYCSRQISWVKSLYRNVKAIQWVQTIVQTVHQSLSCFLAIFARKSDFLHFWTSTMIYNWLYIGSKWFLSQIWKIEFMKRKRTKSNEQRDVQQHWTRWGRGRGCLLEVQGKWPN